jgi:hypothetical protein
MHRKGIITCCNIAFLFFDLQWVLANKIFAYKFNSYIVNTECETKNLQPELSHRIHSRARQHVKSPIKAPKQWCPSQLLLRVHFLKHHQPKTCDRLRTHYPMDLAILVGAVLTMTPRIVHPPPLSRHALPPHTTTLPPPLSLRSSLPHLVSSRSPMPVLVATITTKLPPAEHVLLDRCTVQPRPLLGARSISPSLSSHLCPPHYPLLPPPTLADC